MKITKAVLTVGKPDQRTLPLQRLVDRHGVERSALELNLDEIASAGIESTCIVVAADDQRAYQQAAARYSGNVQFVEQATPKGYGDAIYCARDFVRDEPFLHLVGDHLYLSQTDKTCAQQLVEVAHSQKSAVSAVQPTRESRLPYFGAIGGNPFDVKQGLYRVTTVIEKPTPTEAEQKLVVAGMRSGYYLCMFGMHIITPHVMNILGELLANSESHPQPALSHALAILAQRERFLALKIDGARYDIGVKYGILFAQLAHVLTGTDRDQILSEMINLIADTQPAALLNQAQ
jgi:UTP--glucose-1-phosphate uridylyltransferase